MTHRIYSHCTEKQFTDCELLTNLKRLSKLIIQLYYTITSYCYLLILYNSLFWCIALLLVFKTHCATKMLWILFGTTVEFGNFLFVGAVRTDGISGNLWILLSSEVNSDGRDRNLCFLDRGSHLFVLNDLGYCCWSVREWVESPIISRSVINNCHWLWCLISVT